MTTEHQLHRSLYPFVCLICCAWDACSFRETWFFLFSLKINYWYFDFHEQWESTHLICCSFCLNFIESCYLWMLLLSSKPLLSWKWNYCLCLWYTCCINKLWNKAYVLYNHEIQCTCILLFLFTFHCIFARYDCFFLN